MKKRAVLFLLVVIMLVIPIISSNSNQIKVTLEHPFLVNNEWIEAENLVQGEIIENINGEKVLITNIEKIQKNTEVYNIGG